MYLSAAENKWSKFGYAASFLAALLLLFAFTSSGSSPNAGIIVWLQAMLSPALPLAAAYVLGGIGLGELFRRWCSRFHDCSVITAGLGIASLLSLSHLLGVLGLLNPIVAWAPIIIGLALLGRRISLLLSIPELVRVPNGRWSSIFVVPPCLLLIAGANSPGYLWDSEFGGYDALSYHLQLPQEWLANGRISPLDHNVYSFLPSYVESAFTHLGAMSMAPAAATLRSIQPASLSVRSGGMLAESGWRLVACQQLHILLALFAAWCIYRLGRRVASMLTPDANEWRINTASLLGAGLFLATPWTIVTGSLAYNEMAMLALFAVAMLAALSVDSSDGTAREWTRATVCCAALIGVACGAKPTALTFCGIPAAIVLLTRCPPALWLRIVPTGAAVGVATLLPWLVRNYMHGGNPVFPFAAGLFPNASGGTGHWTAEQVSRYQRGHHFAGSLFDALRLMILPDPNDPSGPRHRGLLHPQWFAYFPIVAASALFALFKRPRNGRLLLCLIASLIAQLALWLFTTHVQSRFLMPLLVPGCMLASAAFAMISSPRNMWLFGFIGTTAVQSIAAGFIFAGQRGGEPNMLLSVSPADRCGETQREYLAARPGEFTAEFRDSLGPEQLVNLALPADAKIVLIGSATPLFFTRPVTYNTTWDRWPNLDELAERGARDGSTFALINFAEIERLARSGTIEPGYTPQKVSDWLSTHARLVKGWQDLGQLLVQVTPNVKPASQDRNPAPKVSPPPHDEPQK
jgi:hypothetical protein